MCVLGAGAYQVPAPAPVGAPASRRRRLTACGRFTLGVVDKPVTSFPLQRPGTEVVHAAEVRTAV